MSDIYQDLRYRAKGFYAAGAAAIILGSLPAILGGVVISSPVGFLVLNPLKSWAIFWLGLVIVTFGFTWLIAGLVTASMAVRLRAVTQVPGFVPLPQ